MEKSAARPMNAPPVYSGQDPATFNTLPSLLDLCREHQISPFFASQLHLLKEYVAIRIIVDDSGSMRTTETDNFGRAHGTRWDELKTTLQNVFDIACAAASTSAPSTTGASQAQNGATISVYFLNGQPGGQRQFHGLHSYAELEPILQTLPVRGTTPTAECLQEVFRPDVMQELGELPVLTILFTDGVPDCGIPTFANLLRNIQTQCLNSFFTIALCTGDDSVVSIYNALDVGVPRVDVMDDYRSERQEVTSIQGRSFPFSKSDYLVKMLLGNRVALWDKLDERRLNRQQRRMFEEYSRSTFGMPMKQSSGSCIIQ